MGPMLDEIDVLGEMHIPGGKVNRETLEKVILLALEIAREGREGRKIGTMFVISDVEAILRRSKCLILDPLACHPKHLKQIGDPNLRETIKELAQLDGAFVVGDDGTVISATRYINASSRGIDIPMGLGSRHVAAASITRDTDAVAVVVSESSMVRVFDDGEIIAELVPELWLLARQALFLKSKPAATRKEESEEEESEALEEGAA